MKIDVVASESHYMKHLLPIWAALPDDLRGTVHPLMEPGHAQRPPMGRIALVAGWQDVAPLRDQCQMIYVEHGAGQTYTGREHDPSYSGSGGVRHRGVIGYIAPSETVANRWTQAPSVAVGCPKMDHWIGVAPPAGEPTVCFAWHWDCRFIPESRSAWEHYEPEFEEIILRFRTQGFRVVAHEHPKWRGEMNKRMESYGIDVFTTDDDVFREANILIVDNSSLAAEFMLLGRPVVFMNAPWYRRDVNHGGRFWEWTHGHPIVDTPEQLVMSNLWDYLPPLPDHAFAISDTVHDVYAVHDGTSSQRAADWITTLLS